MMENGKQFTFTVTIEEANRIVNALATWNQGLIAKLQSQASAQQEYAEDEVPDGIAGDQ